MTHIPNHITTDSTEIMKQAHQTAKEYLIYAIDDVEELLGKDAAEKYPQIVAAYMQTAAIDSSGTIIAQQIRAGLENISDQLEISFPDDLTEHIDHNYQLTRLADGVQHVAEMLDLYSCGRPVAKK